MPRTSAIPNVARIAIAPIARRTARRARGVLLLAFASMLMASCSRANRPEDEMEPPHEPIPVHVKNENFLDMNIAVLAGGVSRRLGQVSGNGAADFKINWSTVSGQQVVLVATPIGGRGPFTSNGVSVGNGQVIEFLVASILRQSSVIVREPY